MQRTTVPPAVESCGSRRTDSGPSGGLIPVHTVAAVVVVVVSAGISAPACGPGSPGASPDGRIGQANPGVHRELPPTARAWVETTLGSLDLRERAAQTVFVWIPGAYVSTTAPAFDSLAALVEEGIGGLNVSIGTPHSVAAKLNALQARAAVPLLVASDFETGGPGKRLNRAYALPELMPMGGGTELPATMAFGAIGNPSYAREAGRISGREARAVGVHLNLAPVVDVNSDPRNPIINTRSYGEDPERVARLAEAFVRGAREAGLMTTAKHFPGHGDTRADPHLELPAVDADRARLDSVELVPFRRLADAGVDAVLTAHVLLPRILGSDAPPATFSRELLTELLRNEWGFRGLVITDALDMAAARLDWGPGEVAVRALEAGADVVLSPPDPRVAVEAVATAVEEERLPADRLEGAVRRILEAKARAGLHRGRTVPLEDVDRIVGRGPHRAFADSAAVRSLTLVRDRDALVPLDASKRDRILSVTLARSRDLAAGRVMDRVLRGSLRALAPVRVEPHTPEARYDSLAGRAETADLVLLSTYLPPVAGEGTVDAPEPFLRFVRRLAASEMPVVLVSFGNPYLLRSVPEVGSYLVAWGGRPPSQRAAARALLGEGPITGRLPVSLPPLHPVGAGVERPGSATGPDHPGGGT